MLEIEYKGGNTVVISTKQGTIVVDPKTSVVGLKDTPTKGAIELATEPRFALVHPDAKLNLEGPGEFGVSGFDIRGVAAQRHLDSSEVPLGSTMYRIEGADIRIAVLGNIYEKLTDAQLEELGIIDVLILPVGGGGYTLDATGAAHVVRAIDPKVVIPIHYADSALKYEVPQDTVETFTKELGAPVEEQTKVKFKQASALPEVMTTYVLARS